MSQRAFEKIREGLLEALQPEPVGHDWLAEFRQRFADEFPEDIQAQQAVEAQGERPAKQGRF